MTLFLNISINKKTVIGIDVEQQCDSDVIVECSSVEELLVILEKKKLKIEDGLDIVAERFFSNQDTEKDQENQFTIKHWVSNRSIGELIDMYDHGEIVKPTMQRNLIWDSVKSSRLIESVLMGLPIPPLFMLEVDNSKYELIDGLQRISTFSNYINGYSWKGDKSISRPSRLSSLITMKRVAGRSFKDLSYDDQRVLKRSTIPLIEFKQLEPDNNESKYLIFERINTRSVKLSEMQIRKSLAHGEFMESLYEMSNSNTKFVSLFSTSDLKKDNHVEAALRVIAITDIYKHKYKTKKTNIGKILNEYCEAKRTARIKAEDRTKFNNAVNTLFEIFASKKDICKRIIPKKGGTAYSGSLQITILEAMLGTLINNPDVSTTPIEDRYKKEMLGIFEEMVRSFDAKRNPFSYSTGTPEAIESRYRTCERIVLGK